MICYAIYSLLVLTEQLVFFNSCKGLLYLSLFQITKKILSKSSLQWKQQFFYLLLMTYKKYQFKAKNFEIKPYILFYKIFQKILQLITWKKQDSTDISTIFLLIIILLILVPLIFRNI